MQVYKDQDNQINNDALPLVQSYLAWWNMAGFDHATNAQLVDWLEKKQAIAENPSESLAPKNDNAPSPQPAKTVITDQTHQENNTLSPDQWPQNLHDFHQALQSGAALPGNVYGKQHIPPHIINMGDNGSETIDQKTIMLIGDFPNEQDIINNSIFSGKENELIVNIMTACAFQNNIVYAATLASTRPIYDELPNQDLPAIHALMHHHIDLLKPDAIICLGSASCNALLSAEMMKSRGNLHYFNHNKISRKLITTFHPRSLLAKPQLKRQAWKDWQILIQKGLS